MNKKTDEKTIKDLTTEEKAALIEQARANMTPEERETARELAEMIGSFAAWWNSGEIVEQRQAAGEMLRTAMNGAKVAAEIFASLQEFLPALLEEMEKDGTAATMTASEFIESGKFDEIVDYVAEKMKADPSKKLLWGTAKCFDHPRYMHGAGTSPSADVFAYAAAQIKKAVESTVELGGNGYVFWGGREGYETLLNTNMGLELDNMARLMRMAVEYGRSIGFTGDFYIEPKPKEPTKHQYDFDTATVLGFLRKYGLDKDFKMNIEANHATLAMHTFQHELRVARDNGFFGSIDANQGDTLLGWDTDQFPTNVYEAALCMYEVLKAGGFTNGGLNFDSKARRGSFTPEDIFHSYIAGMDTFALGLRIAQKMIDDGRIDKFVADRYASWNTGIGKDIIDGKVGFAELEKYALEKGEVTDSLGSGRQEMLEAIMNNIMFSL